MKSDKLFYLTLCFALGIILTTYQPLPWGFFFLALIITGYLVVANRYIFWRKSSIYLLFFFLVLGGARQQITLEALNRADMALLNRDLTLWGTVCEDPVQRQGTIDVILTIYGVADGEASKDKERSSKGTVLVRMDENNFAPGTDIPEYGDVLELRGIVKAPVLPSNPGQFNYRAYCRKLGISGIIYPEHVKNIGAGNHGSSLIKGALALKGQARKVLRETLSSEDYQIADGLLFGSTKGLGEDFKADLQKAGLIHVLSVSGFHVGLVMAGVLLIFSFFKLDSRKVTGFGVILFILIFYAVMTGLRPSVIRATLMAILPLAGYFLGKKANWSSSLALACLVLLVWNPANLFIAGTQLSVAATWGILYLVQPLRKVFGFLPNLIKDYMAVTVAAQLGTLPLIAYHFNYIPWAAALINLLLIPLISLVLLLIFISLISGLIFLPLAYAFTFAVSHLLHLLKLATWWIGMIPFITVNTKAPPLWEGVVYYGAVFLLGYAFSHKLLRMKLIWHFRRNKSLVLAAGTTLLLIIAMIGIVRSNSPLNVTFLDVGQGDCIAVVTPEREVLVIDTGGSVKPGKGFDPGRSILVPYLRSMGIQKVDFLIVSHFHQDHIGGISALLGEFPVSKVLIPPVREDSEEARKLVSILGKLDISVIPVKAGQEIICKGGVALSVLGPGSVFGGTLADKNNNSLLLKLTYGRVSYLLTGDIQQEAITHYCAQESHPATKEDMLSATVLKVPHHGSKGSLDEEFYERVSPRAAIISVGPNFFGHPNSEVIDLLTSKRIPVYRTDTGGAVISLTDGRELIIFQFSEGGL